MRLRATTERCPRRVGEALLPDGSQGDLDLQSLHNTLSLQHVEFAEAAGEELCKDVSKVPTHKAMSTPLNAPYSLTLLHVFVRVSIL